jgi:hypothetical protein
MLTALRTPQGSKKSPEHMEGLPVVFHDPKLSSRFNNLQKSNARSYAASVGHARRKARRRNTRSPSASSSQSTTATLSTRSSSFQQQVSPAAPDPFQIMAIEITPDVWNLIDLWKAHLQANAATEWSAEAIVSQYVVLTSKIQAFGLLYEAAALLTLAVSNQPNLTIRVLQRRQSCLSQLRLTNTSSSGTGSITNIRALTSAFTAAITTNDTHEAALHGKQLQREVEVALRLNGVEVIDIYLALSRAHYNDQQYALTHMRSPILPPLNTSWWEPNFVPIRRWLQANRPLTSSHNTKTNTNIDPITTKYSIADSPFSTRLLTLLASLQEYVLITRLALPSFANHPNRPLLMSSIDHFSMSLTHKLFKHLSYAERWARISSSPATTRIWTAESMLATTALGFLACAGSAPAGVLTLERRGKAVFGRLQELLDQQQQEANINDAAMPGDGCDVVDGPRRQWCQHARLWALYVGAMWELCCVPEDKDDDALDACFVETLKREVQATGIGSSQGLKEIVEGVLHVPPREIGASFTLLGGHYAALWQDGVGRATSAEMLWRELGL